MNIIESHIIRDKLMSQRIHQLEFIPEDYKIKPFKMHGEWVVKDSIANFGLIVCEQDDVMIVKFEVSKDLGSCCPIPRKEFDIDAGFRDKVRKIALENGFKYKQQPDGTMDLNPYVFEFAKALLTAEDLK